MTSFWVISGIFIVTALLFIIPSLLRSRNEQQERVEHDAVNLSVYRDQIAELEKDLENDILTVEQYNKSKEELQQRMLQDIPDREEVVTKKGKKIYNIALSVVITLTLPIAAVSLYLMIGDTRGLLPQAQLANATQIHSGGNQDSLAGHDNFSSVLENLIARLNNNPEDVEGWIMLGRTYAIMERYNEASATYARLIEMIPDNPQLLSDYADVLAMKNDGSLSGKPTELIHEALRIDPNYPKALALAGTAEFEQEKYLDAANYWEKLLEIIPGDSQLAKSVKGSIDEAKLLASGSSLTTNVRQQEKAQENLSPAEDTLQMPDASTLISISGEVDISKELAAKVSPNDTLFIYARAKTGPKMPLAILRLAARDLPASFTLTDDMAMTPTMKMSSFPEVVIEARISKSGQAVPASGDLQGFSKPVNLGVNNLHIMINEQIP